MQMSSQHIYVSIELGEKTHKVGKLWFHQRNARQSASFEYDPDWLKHLENLAQKPSPELLIRDMDPFLMSGLNWVINDVTRHIKEKFEAREKGQIDVSLKICA
jgi:hypothetical protein